MIANAGKDFSCRAALPYPAKRCGAYIVVCTRCQRRVGVSTAGRPDDPRSITIPCKFDKPLPPMA